MEEDRNYRPASQQGFENQDNAPEGHPLADAQYNPDGSIKNPVLTEYGEKVDDPYSDPENQGPPGMPPVAASDGPWDREVIPNGWSRFPTDQEVEYLNKKYPQTGGAPYQPGGKEVEGDDRTAKDSMKDADAKPSDNTNQPDTYGGG